MGRTHAISEPDASHTMCGREVGTLKTTTTTAYDCGVCRQAKITPAMIEDMVELRRLRLAPWKVIAHSVRISEETIHEWRRRGVADVAEGRHTVFAELVTDLQQADAEFEIAALGVIIIDAVGERGLKWMLERRKPETYGKRVEQRHTNRDGDGPVQVEVSEVPWEVVAAMSPEQLKALDEGEDPE